MRNHGRTLALLLPACFLLAACGSHDQMMYKGATYPPTNQVQAAFQANQVPSSCRVFAQALMITPAGLSGEDIDQAVSKEAEARGANMVLIGRSRRSKEGDTLTFHYYGPKQAYPISSWLGWQYGFEEWEQQGEWVDFGYNQWNNNTVRYDYPIVMHVAFLRCK